MNGERETIDVDITKDTGDTGSTSCSKARRKRIKAASVPASQGILSMSGTSLSYCTDYSSLCKISRPRKV